MTRRMSVFFMTGITLLFLSVLGCQQATDPVPISNSNPDNITTNEENGTPIEGQYIVVLKRAALPQGLGKAAATEATIQKISKDYHIQASAIQHKYSHALAGFVGKMSKDQEAEISKDNRVVYIEQDKLMVLGKPPWAGGGNGGGGGSSGQTTPWGITRVGGPIDYTGTGTAWIIDTGIDLDHPDLNVDVSRSKTFVSHGKDAKSPDDGNGHGTHVAGIIAAIDNNQDVVGVAAGATVVAVKVLDSRGSGAYSDVIAGVDYVASSGSSGDVANMSLGGPTSQALDDAVAAAASNGIKFAIAAGNDGDDANNYSPARVNGPNIYTVSAFDNTDAMPYWSNYGNPPVDYATPGVSILSLWKNGGTQTESGTSMSAPHMAGLLLLGAIHSDGTVTGDPDGNPDPIAHY